MPFKGFHRVVSIFKSIDAQYHYPPNTDSTYSSPTGASEYGSERRGQHHGRKQQVPSTRRRRQRRPQGSPVRTPQHAVDTGVVGFDIDSDPNTWQNRRYSMSRRKKPHNAMPDPNWDYNLRYQQHPGGAPSHIPRPSIPPRGYPSRRAANSPSRPLYLGPSLPPPGVIFHRSKSEEDFQSSAEARHIAKHRKEALDMLEGRIPAKGWNMKDFVAMHKSMMNPGPDGSVGGYTFEHYGERVQYRLIAEKVAEKNKKEAEKRSQEMEEKMRGIKAMMGQRRKADQKPTQTPPLPSRPLMPTKERHAGVTHHRQQPLSIQPRGSANRHALAKTAAEREEDLEAAISASLASAKEEARKRAEDRDHGMFPPPSSAKYQQHRHASRYNAPPVSHARSNGHKRTPGKTAAEQEDEDTRRAVAASLADMEQQKPRTWAHVRGEERGRSPLRPQVPVKPAATPRSAEQPRYMAPTQTWRERRAQERQSVSHPDGHHDARIRPSPTRSRGDEWPWRQPPPQAGVPRRGWNNRARPPPPATLKSGVRGNPRDASTGEPLSDQAWDAQIS